MQGEVGAHGPVWDSPCGQGGDAHKIAEGEAPWGLRRSRSSPFRATERLQPLSMWPWRRGRQKWNAVWRLVASPITGSVDVGMSFRRLTMRLLSAAGDPSGPLNNFLGPPDNAAL
jgi:hypothetical protein